MINLHFGKNYREVNSEEQGINGRKSKPERKHWFQKTKKTGLVVLGVVLVLLLANSCWFTIQEEEQAVVCTFGTPKAVTDPGLHFKLPLIQTVTKVNTTIQGIAVGYDSDEEYTDEAMMITSD